MPELPFQREWGPDWSEHDQFDKAHGHDDREDFAHHSETDEHHGSSVYRKPSGQLDAEDERGKAA